MKQPDEPTSADDTTAPTLPGGAAASPDMSTPMPAGMITTNPGAMSTTNPGAAGMITTNPGAAGMKTNVPGMMTTQVAQSLDGVPGARDRVSSDVRAASLTPGTEIDGKYRLEAMLGRGGMGIVWRAEHSHLHGKVAIKFLLDRFRRKPQVIERFWQEAKLMGEMGHPNIVRVLDISPASVELPYITMELLTQGSLRDYLKKSGGKLPADEALELVDGLLSALMAAHRRGIVHRDIKPDNLMLANIRNLETDTFELGIKVLDFGASLLLEAGVEQNAAEGLLGTPYYMSPEQAAGMQLDQRTDLYSTAVVLYELLSGKLPHTAEDVHSLVYSIATEEAKPIAEHVPNITRPYREFFSKALAMDPDRRFQNAEEMRQELRKLSRRLAGKVRNTALYMASDGPSADTTGPQAIPPRRQDTKPLIPFRKALDSQIDGKLPPLREPVPQDSSKEGAGAGTIALGAALGAALGLGLQTARFGSLSEAGVPGVALAVVALAGLGAGIAWWLPAHLRS